MLQSIDIDQDGQVIRGLTEAEAEERRRNGQGNQAGLPATRSYGQILRENVFTFINIVLFSLGFLLVLLRRTSDALISVGVILVNITVNIVQEVRAKRILDRIALINRPTANLLRDGQRRTVDPVEIVIGDTLVIEPGDQFVVDGRVVGGGHLEVDESLLTGESAPIRKKAGDKVYSGSYCITGAACYQVEKVGAQTVSAQFTASARAFRRVLTPLQKQINLVVRVLLLAAGYLEILQLVTVLVERMPLLRAVQMSVVTIGLVPNGLFLAIATAYTLGAVRIARKGALVQQANAIESLSNVDMICLDKTGTLTTNKIEFRDALPYQVERAELLSRLGDFTASVTQRNATSAAIAAACPGQKLPVSAEVAFSSAYKWSGITFTGAESGVYILGAPEVLGPHLNGGLDLAEMSRAWSEDSLRVVAFAYTPTSQPITDSDGNACLPQELNLLGLVALGDELRPGAQQTLDDFIKAGVNIKIISGDNPATVAALARQAGYTREINPISGLDLAQMEPAAFDKAVNEKDIFGRITPQQKEQIVAALQARGHYVAMIGDGVNDVLSLKKANLAIALQSGSQASRSVADLILLENSFTVLPEVLLEGQRILVGMQDVLKIFLSRITFSALLIMASGFAGSFPFTPKHNSLLTLLTVGLPTLALAAWAKPGFVRSDRLVRKLLHFVLPAGVTLSLAGLFVFVGYLLVPEILAGGPTSGAMGELEYSLANLPLAQTAITTFSIFCGLLLLIFAEPPTRFWVGGDRLSTDRRPSYLAGVMLCLYLVILALPGPRRFFELYPIGLDNLLLLAGLSMLWALGLRWIWRSRVLDRFLNIDLEAE